MSISSRGTPFWGKVTKYISPGDIFPDVPFACAKHPLRIIRKSDWNPPPGRRQDIYYLVNPASEAPKPPSKLTAKEGDDAEGIARLLPAMFLSWGSEVEDDQRNIERTGRVGGRVWVAAPVYDLSDLPDDKKYNHPETGALVSMRELVKENRTHHAFYLPPLPTETNHLGRYVDFKRIAHVRVAYFLDNVGRRIATLMPDALNDMYHQLIRFFTRAEIFLHTLKCPR